MDGSGIDHEPRARASHRALTRVAHRPWPLPQNPWLAAQAWSHLLFAHYPVPTALLRKHVPHDLELEEWGGTAWLGIVSFDLAIRARFTPYVPKLGTFPELNLRTYVTRNGKPGVWFFSLDAANGLAVWAARTLGHLPYFRAHMKSTWSDGWMRFTCIRNRNSAVAFDARYRPTGPVYEASAGSLEHWLTERYCLYTLRHHHVSRIDIHHWPWPLQSAEAIIEHNTLHTPILGPAYQFSDAPLLHYAAQQKVVTWAPIRD